MLDLHESHTDVADVADVAGKKQRNKQQTCMK